MAITGNMMKTPLKNGVPYFLTDPFWIPARRKQRPWQKWASEAERWSQEQKYQRSGDEAQKGCSQ